ncbi:MAG: hypothetical protein GXP47_00295 [Acidobacteria bacterium]|nr:hypothetical protein [Acidobacteriota bacterium]
MAGNEDPGRCQRAAGRLLGKLRRTCRRWDLLPRGGNLGIAVSGGADSLVLVELLRRLTPVLEHPPELVAFHVALDGNGITAGLGDAVRRWLDDLGIPLHTVPPRFDASETVPATCFQCARIRRRTLLEAADSHGVHHLALGHHADDAVETWLMSLFYTGTPEAMAPRRSYFGGAVTLVRPLFEIRRQEIARVARLCGLPVTASRCPVEAAGTKRDAIRRSLAALGRDQRRVRRQLFWALVRQLREDTNREDTNGSSCATVREE